MGEKKLYVNLLGEFSVWYGDKKVYMGRTSTGRQAQLFQLLMISPGFQISKEKLMADIYKSGEFNNRNNSVNNAVYRLRKMLTDAGGGVQVTNISPLKMETVCGKEIYLFR